MSESVIKPGGSSAREDLKDQVRTVGKEVAALGRQSKEAASEVVDDAKERVGEFYEQGRAKAGEYGDHVSGYVQDSPMKSLLIAAGAGVLVGFLLSRR